MLLRNPFKLGVGRLIAEAAPLVLPFYHYGMQNVMPIGSHVPRIGKTVNVRFAEAIDTEQMFPDWFDRSNSERVWSDIAEWAYTKLRDLELVMHPLATETQEP